MSHEIKTLESRSELLEQFRRVSEPKLLIDCSDSSPNQYKLIQIDSFTAGLIDHSFGVPIQIDSTGDPSTLLIGHESQLDCISVSAAKVLWTFKLDSVFFQFKSFKNKSCIVVIEETGVLVLDYNGNKIWSYPTDVITDYQITDSAVMIKTMDEKDLELSITTGKLLS